MTEWERCAPWIQAALDNQTERTGLTTHLLGDVRTQVERGEAQFWPFEKSAAVTEIIDHPQLRQFHLWLCGGSWRDLEQHLDRVLAWAKAEGCEWTTTAGRVGWKRVMAKHGFDLIAEVCGRRI